MWEIIESILLELVILTMKLVGRALRRGSPQCDHLCDAHRLPLESFTVRVSGRQVRSIAPSSARLRKTSYSSLGELGPALRTIGRRRLGMVISGYGDGQSPPDGDLGPNPTDHAKMSTKRSVITDCTNRYDTKLMPEKIETMDFPRPFPSSAPPQNLSLDVYDNPTLEQTAGY